MLPRFSTFISEGVRGFGKARSWDEVPGVRRREDVAEGAHLRGLATPSLTSPSHRSV